MRNKLGIIQLELGRIVLDDEWGTGSETDITESLSENQKRIIKNLGDSKLVLLRADIEDSQGVLFPIKNGFMSSVYKTLTFTAYNYVNDQICSIALYEDSGTYYIVFK